MIEVNATLAISETIECMARMLESIETTTSMTALGTFNTMVG